MAGFTLHPKEPLVVLFTVRGAIPKKQSCIQAMGGHQSHISKVLPTEGEYNSSSHRPINWIRQSHRPESKRHFSRPDRDKNPISCHMVIMATFLAVTELRSRNPSIVPLLATSEEARVHWCLRPMAPYLPSHTFQQGLPQPLPGSEGLAHGQLSYLRGPTVLITCSL